MSMKRGQKHAPQPKPAPAAPARVIPPHIAALGIVKSVRRDGSYVCIHDQELTECDECAPLALLADEEAGGQVVLDAARDEGLAAEDRLRARARPVEDSTEFRAPEVRPVHDPLLAAASDDAGISVSFTCPGCGKPIGGGCWGCDGSRDTAASGPAFMPAEPMPEDLSVACAALGLASEHVLTHAIRGDGSVSIITRGGSRLAWPCTEEQRQAARALTDQQRDGLIRDDEGNILPRGKWRTTPHKF